MRQRALPFALAVFLILATAVAYIFYAGRGDFQADHRGTK